MKERVLIVTLDEAILLFQTIKWKFFEVLEEEIRIEVPRGEELFVVDLYYSDSKEFDKIKFRLQGEGFIQQEIRYR